MVTILSCRYSFKDPLRNEFSEEWIRSSQRLMELRILESSRLAVSLTSVSERRQRRISAESAGQEISESKEASRQSADSPDESCFP